MADNAEPATTSRGTQAASAFVELVDALVDDFDVIDILTVLTRRCVELIDADAAAILLADGEGALRVIGASNEQARLLELLQVQNEEGPCLDSFRGGHVISHADLTLGSPWPRFAAVSVSAGYPSVCALPLRLRGLNMGCLNLFMSEPRQLNEEDVALAQGLADVASIAIVQNESAREAAVRETRLQSALESRVVIEQAKGMIAAQSGVDMDGAFSRLRSYARNNNQRLTDVATEIVAGSVSVGSITSRPPPVAPPGHRATHLGRRRPT